MGDVDVLALRYGQKLRLCAPSTYVKDDATASPDLGIGYYEKHGRHGILSAVPPLGDGFDMLFNEDEYLVLDPQNLRAPGDVVEFGHTVVLVNQHGMVWNNKTGGITGYVGPRPRGIPGEMYVSFRRGNSKDTVAKETSTHSSRIGSRTALPAVPTSAAALDRDVTTASATSSSSASFNGMESSSASSSDGPVHFGDTNVAITVMESNRHSQMYNKRLTNFKKPTSQIVGGYICCDGKGAELRFTLRPAKPKVEQIAMLNKLITAYNYGQKIALPMGVLLEKDHAKMGLQHAEIFFKLSNQTTATLPGEVLHEKILWHASRGATTTTTNAEETETEFALPLSNGPGELVLKLTGVVPKRALAKLVAASQKGRASSSIQAAAIPAARVLPPTITLLQRAGAVARMLPVPAFALLYAMLTHFVWSTPNAETPRDSALTTYLTTAVLLLVPALYGAARIENHPLASLFFAPVRAADPADDEAHVNVSLKMIITEYRFAPSSSSSIETVVVPNGSQALALVAPGSTGAVPLRYIKAEKGDEVKGRERYMATLAWRQEKELATILSRPWPHFRMIKTNYPHYYHKRGLHDEPVYYEKPGKINLKALKAAGVTLQDLMHNYLMVTEFLWQVLEPDDNKKCISVLDVEGIGLSDFAGEAVEYVRNAAAVSGSHYPERCAYIFVINVPSWFSMIWNTVKTMVDEVTRDKVIIIRGNKKKIFEALAEKIPVENIPEEYGGESVGMAKEETLLYNLMAHLNEETRAGNKTNPIDDYRKEQKLLAASAAAQRAAPASASVPALATPVEAKPAK